MNMGITRCNVAYPMTVSLSTLVLKYECNA
uniref:Uncharacterized protein n=1 Tax=Anguilla anguilla TaxID=7936 RepID=A0A0E9XV36_ANGAN